MGRLKVRRLCVRQRAPGWAGRVGRPGVGGPSWSRSASTRCRVESGFVPCQVALGFGPPCQATAGFGPPVRSPGLGEPRRSPRGWRAELVALGFDSVSGRVRLRPVSGRGRLRPPCQVAPRLRPPRQIVPGWTPAQVALGQRSRQVPRVRRPRVRSRPGFGAPRQAPRIGPPRQTAPELGAWVGRPRWPCVRRCGRAAPGDARRASTTRWLRRC